MSLDLGNLRERPLPEILESLHEDARTGVLRLRRQSGAPGQERADLVLREGLLVGAALFRDGGVRGMGDSLVEEALCSPEEAAQTQEAATTVSGRVSGALASGAERAGVAYGRVVEALANHIQSVLRQVVGWTGPAEFLLEDLPVGAEERDSAPARAFLLDEGIPYRSILSSLKLDGLPEGAHHSSPIEEEEDPEPTVPSDAAPSRPDEDPDGIQAEEDPRFEDDVLAVMEEMGASAAASSGATAGEPGRISTGHVVVVDDEGQLGRVLVPELRKAALTVHSIVGLADAFRKLSAVGGTGERPLVISDLLLQREGGAGMLGGLDLASHAAGFAPPIPVILLAETTSDEVRARSEEAGVLAVLTRPMKRELERNVTARETFLAELLAIVDVHRPRPTWVPIGASADSGDFRDTDSGKEWDVDAIAEQSLVVEDLPDLTEDPEARQDALWREAMHTLSAPMSPPEILLQILRFGAEVLARGVLFVPSGKELSGFGQFGVGLAPGVDPDEAVRQIRIAAEEHPGIRAVIEARAAARIVPGDSEWEEYLARSLGGVKPPEVFLGPVFCQGKVAALLYGDPLGTAEPIPETTSLEVVLGQAGLALDRAALEAKVRALEGFGRGDSKA